LPAKNEFPQKHTLKSFYVLVLSLIACSFVNVVDNLPSSAGPI